MRLIFFPSNYQCKANPKIPTNGKHNPKSTPTNANLQIYKKICQTQKILLFQLPVKLIPILAKTNLDAMRLKASYQIVSYFTQLPIGHISIFCQNTSCTFCPENNQLAFAPKEFKSTEISFSHLYYGVTRSTP